MAAAGLALGGVRQPHALPRRIDEQMGFAMAVGILLASTSF
jgi:hypothetical protein